MKITTGILGCALVAGLMTFASNKAQASSSLVISNVIYAPFNLKLSTEYPDGNKFKKASLTSKEWLKDNNYDTSKVKLAINTVTYEVWIVNKDSALVNLSSGSTNGTLTVSFDAFSTVKPNENKESFKQIGVFGVASDAASSFEVEGVYSRSYSSSTVKNGEFNYKDDLKATDLSGSGVFPGLTGDSELTLPVTGTTDFKGSAKLALVL